MQATNILPINPPKALQSGKANTVRQSCLSSLQNWRMEEALPVGLTSHDLDLTIACQKAWLQPVEDRAFAVIIDRILNHTITFGTKLDGETMRSAVSIYRDHLGDLPVDLLQSAVDQTCKTWNFWDKLPPPSFLLAKVEADLEARRADRRKLELAATKMKLHPAQKPVSRWGDSPDAEKQALQAKIDAVKAMASTKAGEKFGAAVGAGRPLTEDTPSEELTDGLSPDQLKAYWLARLDEKTPSQARALAKGDKAP